jgi:nucleoside-diphosphate-sugar epimerase
MTLIALTGATGFIGRKLVAELPKRGYRVRLLLRRPAQIPLDCDSAVIGDLARPQNLTAALRDVSAVVHSAGIAPGMSGTPADDYRAINTEATGALARAAERGGVRRFVFMSSIRAQCGPSAEGVVTEATPAQPADPYGASKLAAEQELANLAMDWVALRPVLVYGPGVQGNMSALVAAARARYPLPLSGLTAQRSLLALDNLVEAVVHVLAMSQPLHRPLIVADAQALTVAEMITAMRAGLGRRPGLFPVPEALVKFGLQRSGKDAWVERLCQPLVASSAALQALGWSPPVTTSAGLAALMKAR